MRAGNFCAVAMCLISVLPLSGNGQGTLPPGALLIMSSPEAKAAQEDLIKKTNPQFYVFQMNLRELDRSIKEQADAYYKPGAQKAEIKAKLLALIEKREKILKNPSYLVEVRLMSAYTASPQYQAEMKKIIKKFPNKAQSIEDSQEIKE